MQLSDLVVPGVVVLLGYGVVELGRWMIRRPERLEEVVWPDPKPVDRRDLSATRRIGSLLVFFGAFLSLMIVGIGILAILPTAARTNPVAFPLILAFIAFAAYRVRRAVLRQATR